MSRKIVVSLCILTACVGLAPPLRALQSRDERKAAQAAEAEAPQSVGGGATFERSAPADQTYDDLLNWAKREGYVLTSASRETGQIVTEIQVAGSYRQTGTRVYLTTIKDGDAKTTVRVAVSEQKRFKALQTEPWGTPKVNADKSRDLAKKIQAAIQ